MRISERWQAFNVKNVSRSQNRNLSKYSKASIIAYVVIFSFELFATLVKLANGMAVDHCYSDIGCFPLSEEFYHPRHRPFNVRPWHRRLINTRFLLFNRHHSDGFILEPWDKTSLAACRFDPNLETKIIIPGWLDSLDRAVWVKRLKDSLLWLWHPVNIIIVHWQNFTPYTIATANTRVVGAELANLLKFIESELNYDRSYYHIIGHSLGAHIAGYCGDRLAGLGRITALDPARPFFQHMPKSVRLDRGDAKFVDAIHSDFTPENAIFLLMSYGMSTPVGHLDFYPNGHSYLQPGCLRDTLLSVQNGIMRGLEHASLSVAFLEAIRYMTACDHQRSHEWFIESITNRQCTFVGVRCNEFEGLINGRCTCEDSPSACAIMGIHADQMYVHNLHEEIWPLGQRGSGRNRDSRNYHKSTKRPSPSALITASPLRPDFLDQQQIVRPIHPLAEMFEENVVSGAIISNNRNQIYHQLLHEAARLRQPPMPNPILADEMYVGLDHMGQDTAFVNYLRANLKPPVAADASVPIPAIFASPHNMISPVQDRTPIPIPRPSHIEPKSMTEYEDLSENSMKRRFDAADTNFKDDVELIFSGNNAHPMNKHPKLLSDLDRDIENWYEDSSRWFLKTNNRPNYCVNQYQILIYLGPLKTTNGHKRLRANILVSIIGSRGQLMNQRFIPRSANLDSFTMQPFFVILEGSYTLGNILSVAVGWEARTDPDPVHATISFQSSLLENVQASLPAPPRLRPFLGETMKFDFSSGFTGSARKPSQKSHKISKRSSSSVGITRRSLMLDGHNDHTIDGEKCLIEDDETGKCSISQLDILQEAKSEEQARQLTELLLAENKNDAENEGTHQHTNDSGGDIPKSSSNDRNPDHVGSLDELRPNGKLGAALAFEEASLDLTLQAQQIAASQLQMMGIRPEMAASQHHPHIEQTAQHHTPYGWPLPRPSVPISHEDFLQEHGNRITAEFHNINHLHHLEENSEDSIVINQVVVNPLQAYYGVGVRPGKVFCPAHPSKRLKRDRTIKLMPNLLGRCPVNHNHHV